MPKRANNEGHIRERNDGRWEARYSAGYTSDGKPIRRSVYGQSQGEVAKKLLQIRTQIEEGRYVAPERLTVAMWLDTWLEEYVRPSKRPATYFSYRNTIEKHLKPTMGRVVLQKLRTEHVQAAMNRAVEKGFASSTVTKARNVIHAALGQAVTNQLLSRNIVDGVRIPKLEQEEIKPLSLDEQKRFAQKLPATSTGRALAFVLVTGLRVGELCGVRWKDIEEDALNVKQTVRRSPNIEKDAVQKTSIQTGKPKSAASVRRIPLSVKAKDLLEAQRKEQLISRMKFGGAWHDTGLVFTSEMGTPLDTRNVSRVMYRVLDMIQADQRGVHALRHTFATRAVESGMDARTLSEILGHGDIATTLRLYVHSSMEVKQRGVNLLDQFM